MVILLQAVAHFFDAMAPKSRLQAKQRRVADGPNEAAARAAAAAAAAPMAVDDSSEGREQAPMRRAKSESLKASTWRRPSSPARTQRTRQAADRPVAVEIWELDVVCSCIISCA